MRLASIIHLLASFFLLYPVWCSGQAEESKKPPLSSLPTAQLQESDIMEWLKKASSLKFSQPDSSFIYANYALEASQKMGFKRLAAQSYKELGNTQYVKSDFNEALKYYQLSLDLFTELQDEKAIAGVKNNQGIIHKNLGNYPQAADAYYQSLELAEKMDDEILQARIHRNIGSVYFLQKDYDKGISAFESSLQLLKKPG